MPPKPNLTYLYGYTVESVASSIMGTDILFDGGARVSIEGEPNDLDEIGNLKGKKLLMVTMSNEETVMRFGITQLDGPPVEVVDISVGPTSYAVEDPRFEGGAHYPQRALLEPMEEAPDDPSTERAAESPSEPEPEAEAVKPRRRTQRPTQPKPQA